LNSRNGSFIGSSPLELSRVPKGTKAPLSFGDYIRFGHSQKLFRYLEKIPPSPLPIIEQPLDEEDELQVLPTEQGELLTCLSSFMGKYYFGGYSRHAKWREGE
jgi:hypothetical protein